VSLHRVNPLARQLVTNSQSAPPYETSTAVVAPGIWPVPSIRTSSMTGLVVRPEPAPKNVSPNCAREMRTTLEWGFASGEWSVAVLTLGTPVMRRSPLGVMAMNVSPEGGFCLRGVGGFTWIVGEEIEFDSLFPFQMAGFIAFVDEDFTTGKSVDVDFVIWSSANSVCAFDALGLDAVSLCAVMIHDVRKRETQVIHRLDPQSTRINMVLTSIQEQKRRVDVRWSRKTRLFRRRRRHSVERGYRDLSQRSFPRPTCPIQWCDGSVR
jgi:hypothetical protein